MGLAGKHAVAWSSLPWPLSALPRLLWASAQSGLIASACWQHATAASNLPCSLSATPRLLCASA